ncbi:MAG: hypothetical protein OEY83_01100 [Candidatus Bathyarchaeota archaeon]|nr:hypothetical protein [Candidatus Bathyarchaeota archaeon]
MHVATESTIFGLEDSDDFTVRVAETLRTLGSRVRVRYQHGR